MAIEESQHTDSEKSGEDDNSVQNESVDTAQVAENVDNVINHLNNAQKESDDEMDIDAEAAMRKNIRRMSVQPLQPPSLLLNLAETSHSDDEKPKNTKNGNELTLPVNNVAMGQKKKIGKTKSAPGNIIWRNSGEKKMVRNDSSDKLQKGDDRQRSSSEPDIDMSPQEIQAKKKGRKLSIHNLGFRKKSHSKGSKVDTDSDSSNNNKVQDDEYYSKHHKEITDDDSEDEKPPEVGFLRRMSVQIKNTLFKEEDEKDKTKLEVLDISDEREGHTKIRKMSITELLHTGMFVACSFFNPLVSLVIYIVCLF